MTDRCPIVVIAERELAWSRPLRVELRRRGATILLAISRDETIWLCERFKPDMLILDEALEGNAPDDLVARIWERSPKTRTAVLMTDVSTAQEQSLREHGVVYIGTKSAPWRELQTAIEQNLHGVLRSTSIPPREPSLILCVDDDALYLKSLQRVLIRQGYRVAAYQDPEQALEAIPQIKPDLAILDVRMPKMNGLNLAEEIHDSYGELIPIVMLSGLDDDEDISNGYQRGARYYITKPCEPQQVLNVVDYLVGDLDTTEKKILEPEL